MRIAFSLPNALDARYKKKVDALEKNDVEATILAFKRNYYPGHLIMTMKAIIKNILKLWNNFLNPL